jgi:iron complex transport system ATP-binding protein
MLKCITRLLNPQTGTVLIEQQDISKLNDIDVAKLRSVVLSDRIYPFNMTAMEIIMLGRHPHQTFLTDFTQKDRQIIQNCIGILEIADLVDKKFYELSDGQKQKVLIARALCQEPKVLVLDEPATHLDAKSRIEILLKLRHIAGLQNITVIASMHEIEIAYRISDKILVLDDGKLRKYDSPQAIFSTDTISEIYLNEKTVWNPIFGSFELKLDQTNEPRIHVVGGYGTGIPVYRLLARFGQNFSTGILDVNDVDHHLASTIGAKVFSNEITDDPICCNSELVDKLGNISLVIDTAFPVNSMTRQNIDFVKEISKKSNAVIFSLREPEKALEIYDSFKVNCGNFGDLEKLCLTK